MKTMNLENWEAFQSQLSTLSEKYPWASKSAVTPMLFRGQADASWKLQTTLERYPVSSLKAARYYMAISDAKPQMETYTNQSWEIPAPHEYAQKLENLEFGFSMTSLPAYDYMIYLRHHGFPSPLLDWTISPYVAAFFAFRNASSSVKQVSIYAYLEYPELGKMTTVNDPHIFVCGSYIRSHRRHFLQQCAYTTCTVKKEDGNKADWQYACHEDVFVSGNEDQDLLWKFNLPAIERTKVLRSLDLYNLNGYSLFGTEESLMETVAQREILFRQI
jgi:hypothetical protein